ncbi:MAG: rRNA maturation RNase YbeY [Clostridiaceae bacterium]|nr:rRNA maturation RNase YbeY [Clostridiaceae bacterium]
MKELSTPIYRKKRTKVQKQYKKICRRGYKLRKTEILLENSQNIIEVDEKLKELIENAIGAVLDFEGFDQDVEISITLVDNEQIREINREYRNKDAETDVLSFPMLEFDEKREIIPMHQEGDYNRDENVLVLGDIVISLEKAREQAQEYGHSFEREVGFLTVHSVFHLLGYDHEEEEQAKEMREKEEQVLQKLNLVRE